MSFEESIQTIERRLRTSSLLVSDATVMLLVLLRARKESIPRDLSPFYDQLEGSLTRELLGYETGQMDTTSTFRRCNIRTARIVDGIIVYIPNTVSQCTLYMVWGSQEVEALLAEILDLRSFQSGDQNLIDQEIERLEATSPAFHTESGFPEVWATFDGLELLRLYMQLRSVLIQVCKELLELERQAVFVASPQTTSVAQISF